MSKSRKSVKTEFQPGRDPLPKDKRHSATKASVPVFPEFGPKNQTKSEIRVISPVYFKNNRGKVFEQARDGESVFVIKRHDELMAIVCGYSHEILARILETETNDVESEMEVDPKKQRVSVEELLEFIKSRKKS